MKTVIRAEKLSKQYTLGKKSFGDLRNTLTNFFSKSVDNNEKEKLFWALKDVSFEIKEGEVVGLVGKNGAGKSTLLKILSKITEPTDGKAYIYGRVASLLEVGTGFHPELTGRENIFLNGAILGMKRSEIKRKFDEIVEFSCIEKFIDTPVKRYSSGMYVRLAFAVAAHLEAEIMFIDEVLAVGDIEFQKKCLGKMGDVAKSGRTIIFVSHNMGAVNTLCNKGFFLKQGELIATGGVGEIAQLYFEDLKSSTQLKSSTHIEISQSQELPDIPYRIIGAELRKNGKPLEEPVVDVFDKISICLQVECRKSVKNYSAMIHCNNEFGRLFSIFEVNSIPEYMENRPEGIYWYEVDLPCPLLKEGRYTFDLEMGHFGVGPEQMIKNALSLEVQILSRNPRFEAYSINRQNLVAVVPEWKIINNIKETVQ